MVSDAWVGRRSSLRNKLNCLRQGDMSNFFNSQVRRAETRQALQALDLLGRVRMPPVAETETENDDVEGWLERLDWRRPWAAGSHASHHLFFLAQRREAGEHAGERGQERA